MSVIVRGTKNALRNPIRSFSVVIILAISIGLTLVMLLAMRTVQSRIESVKSSIGNTITVSPAGARGFAGGGEPLAGSDVASIQSTEHVTSVKETLNDRLNGAADTSLVSAIDAGTLGNRFNRRQGGQGQSQDGAAPSTPTTIPIQVTGTTDPTSTQVAGSNQLNITSGSSFDGGTDAAVALVGASLATKNSLATGGSFMAYGQTITVAGIYDAGNTFANAGIIMPLSTVQRLSALGDVATSVIVQVDSISNLATTTTALQSTLGSKADVVSSQDSSSEALAPLENIKTISFYSLIGSLAAGAIIIFLTMLMIVRERRREIGVLKAIGASNAGIVVQFVVESLTLTLLGAIVGVVAGVLLSNPILGALVSSNSATATTTGAGGAGAQRMFGRGLAGGLGRVGGTINNLHAVVGYDILLYGLAAAIIIAILGSAIPAWFISKIRPAEVMRSE
jgi:putative ABC transport system permease protein